MVRAPRGCDRQPGFALDVRAHLLFVLAALFAVTCSSFRHAGTAGEVPVTVETGPDAAQEAAIAPVLVTEPVVEDSDDPAIWLHPDDPSRSLVIGTDKGGYLFVFDLEGRIIAEKTVSGLGRMNNVDVEYGLMLDGVPTDIAVATERPTSKLRIYRLPEMTPVDGGGVEVFADQAPANRPMGVALFKRPTDGAVFAIVSRKEGPSGSYLWQYRLHDDGEGQVTAIKVREFGAWSGVTEIEAVAVDDVLGYVYYSDESTGIRKYHADYTRRLFLQRLGQGVLATGVLMPLWQAAPRASPETARASRSTGSTTAPGTFWCRISRRTSFACSPARARPATPMSTAFSRRCGSPPTRATDPRSVASR